MSKGTNTRALILKKTVGLFNKHGFAGVSMSQVMEVTGLKKGGIYNHFDSKEALALAAFDYAISQVRTRFREGLKGKRSAEERLKSILTIMHRYVVDPPVEGGCPIQNLAADSVYNYPRLQKRAQAGMDELLNYIRRIVQKGIECGEVNASENADEVASVMISTLEGALLLSKLYDNASYMDHAVAHLTQYVENKVAGVVE